MIRSLYVWHMGQQMQLAVPVNALVFDGFEFVRPETAARVVLTSNTVTFFQHAAAGAALSLDTLEIPAWYVCDVIGVSDTVVPGPTEIKYVADPNDGECICGLTCLGTHLQFVPVEYAEPEELQ